MNQLLDYLFNFHSKHRALAHLVFWVLVYGLGFFTDNLSGTPLNTQQNFVCHLMMLVSKIPIAYYVVYIVIPIYVDNKKYLKAICLFLLFYYLNFCLSEVFKIMVYPYFQIYVVKELEVFSLIHFFNDYFISNIGVTAVMVLIKLFLHRSEVQQRALLLDKQKSEIELKLLKTQLNPHFLFNTLNNIYTLSILNSPKTSESISRLSDILDYILYRCNPSKVPLKNEVKLIKNYIELEKLRYDSRLEVTFNEYINCNVEIAPLVLLTLVENAFKHGASEDAGSPKIIIELNAVENAIEFKIENTMASLPSYEKVTSGIGLQNLNLQLDLIYGKDYKLEITKGEKLFSVLLKINIK